MIDYKDITREELQDAISGIKMMEDLLQLG